MATLDWPNLRAFAPRGADGFALGLRSPKTGFAAAYTGQTQTLSHAADRLRLSLTLPPCEPGDAALREAYVCELISAGHWVRLGHLLRPEPLGTLRGVPTVAAAALTGARSLTLRGATAGGNLLRRADEAAAYGSAGWLPTNATVLAETALAPDGRLAADAVVRGAPGNHYVARRLVTTVHAGRTYAFRVWVNGGTLAGTQVALSIRDGAGNTVGLATYTMTSGWQDLWVVGRFGASPAADVLFLVDPVSDAGAAGDTFYVYAASYERSARLMEGCVVYPEATTDPAGLPYGERMFATTTGETNFLTTVDGPFPAGTTLTYSMQMRRGSMPGFMQLVLYGYANDVLAFGSFNPDTTWQTFSITHTLAAAQDNVKVMFNPAATTGAVNDTVDLYGEQLVLGRARLPYERLATLRGGDVLASGNQLLLVGYAGAVGDVAGNLTVPLSVPLRKPVAAGDPVQSVGGTGLWELVAQEFDFPHGPGGWQRPITLPFREVLA